jgi:hypothetical protein
MNLKKVTSNHLKVTAMNLKKGTSKNLNMTVINQNKKILTANNIKEATMIKLNNL